MLSNSPDFWLELDLQLWHSFVTLIKFVAEQIYFQSLSWCDMPLNKSWHDYNESLIERGRVLIDVSFLKSSNIIKRVQTQ